MDELDKTIDKYILNEFSIPIFHKAKEWYTHKVGDFITWIAANNKMMIIIYKGYIESIDTEEEMFFVKGMDKKQYKVSPATIIKI